jgi:hypothetical protein
MLEAILVGIIDAFLLRKTMQFCSGVDKMRTNLLLRLAKLEAALALNGRVFLMWDDGWHPDFDGPPLEERLAAFETDNGVGPCDTVTVFSFLRADDPEPVA